MSTWRSMSGSERGNPHLPLPSGIHRRPLWNTFGFAGKDICEKVIPNSSLTSLLFWNLLKTEAGEWKQKWSFNVCKRKGVNWIKETFKCSGSNIQQALSVKDGICCIMLREFLILIREPPSCLLFNFTVIQCQGFLPLPVKARISLQPFLFFPYEHKDARGEVWLVFTI